MAKIAILVEQEYQDLEVWYPFLRLREAGHEVVIVGTEKKEYIGKYGYPIKADIACRDITVSEYDGVIIPGGWAPDFMRRTPAAAEFVAVMLDRNKMVASICHGGWILVSSKRITGRTVTSFMAVRDDLEAAGAQWVDEACVIDNNLITARTPDDLPVFIKAILAAL